MKITKTLVLGLACLSTTFVTAKAQAQVARPPQYILMSFDGSYTLEMWKATREHGLRNNARYTHFISGVDFLTGSSARKIPGSMSHIYTPPRFNGRHRSNIGFGGDQQMLAGRLREVVKSIQSGMEIGGHANGHFDGTKWTKAEWEYEFDLYHEYLWNPIAINRLSPLLPDLSESNWKALMRTQHRGFRAPFLGRSGELYKAMGNDGWKIDGAWTNHRYTYDASGVSSQLSAWPTRRAEGIWDFPLVTIPVPGRSRPILSMDYNFYVAQSAGKEDARNGARYEEEMYQAYVNWFSRNYHGNRAPMNIGHHFSTWNKGAYWRALQRFVESVCTQPEVRCVTYMEMVQVLESGLASQIGSLNQGNFSQANRPKVSIPLVRLANAEVGADFSQFVQAGRYLKMDEKSDWSVDGVNLKKTEKVDLVEMAKRGVTFVKRTANQESQELLIDWNPASDEVKLKKLEAPDLQRCDADAHHEKVNPMYLEKGIDI